MSLYCTVKSLLCTVQLYTNTMFTLDTVRTDPRQPVLDNKHVSPCLTPIHITQSRITVLAKIYSTTRLRDWHLVWTWCKSSVCYVCPLTILLWFSPASHDEDTQLYMVLHCPNATGVVLKQTDSVKTPRTSYTSAEDKTNVQYAQVHMETMSDSHQLIRTQDCSVQHNHKETGTKKKNTYIYMCLSQMKSRADMHVSNTSTCTYMYTYIHVHVHVHVHVSMCLGLSSITA